MIVRSDGDSLLLVTQPDHAALAGRVMEAWRPLMDAERRMSILLAIAEHDNGWREADEAPTIDGASGRIFDFVSAPADIRQAVWPRGIARVARQDRWAAALIAQHALTVYERYRRDDAWEAFFAELETTREALLQDSALSLPQLVDDYTYVRVGDLISLIFCNGWRDEETFGDCRFWLEGDGVRVAPDAFNGERVLMEVRARRVTKKRYASNEELLAEWLHAPAATLRGWAAGPA